MGTRIRSRTRENALRTPHPDEIGLTQMKSSYGSGGGAYSASFSSGTKNAGAGFNAGIKTGGGGGYGGSGYGSGGVKTSQQFHSSGDGAISLDELFNQIGMWPTTGSCYLVL